VTKNRQTKAQVRQAKRVLTRRALTKEQARQLQVRENRNNFDHGA
jgi:hypothetical protein